LIKNHGDGNGQVVEFKTLSDAQSVVNQLWPALEAKTQLASKLVGKMSTYEFDLLLVDCVHKYACSFNEAEQPSSFDLYQSYITLLDGLFAANHTIRSILGPGSVVMNPDAKVLLVNLN
jgi:hypothetical protein